MAGNQKLVAAVRRQASAGPTLPYDEIKWDYPPLKPSSLQSTGLSPRGAKELTSGKPISNPKDRMIVALIVGAALK